MLISFHNYLDFKKQNRRFSFILTNLNYRQPMKIYTKTGDKGKTSLVGGTRISKHDIRLNAYGTVDELISWIGVLRDQQISKEDKNFLVGIQDRLMVCASHLATDQAEWVGQLPAIFAEDITSLENAIDLMETKLPPLTSFVLPGGHPAVSWCHVARTVCRRAEREVLVLNEKYEVSGLIIKFLNRLSDYLFVFARKISMDFRAEEIPWKP
jgi:cob(I)alamin adenosyltransferase